MVTEVGISIPSRAYQVGVEEFEVRFLGDTFSFSVKLSDHALEAMHSLGREFASFQKSRATDDELIPVGTSFGGVELLEMFHQQLLPRPKNENPKSRGGIAGMAGPGGKAISFFPSMPPDYMKTAESHEYSFKIASANSTKMTKHFPISKPPRVSKRRKHHINPTSAWRSPRCSAIRMR